MNEHIKQTNLPSGLCEMMSGDCQPSLLFMEQLGEDESKLLEAAGFAALKYAAGRGCNDTDETARAFLFGFCGCLQLWSRMRDRGTSI